jgi:mannosyltransferase OCH1-like enzyme
MLRIAEKILTNIRANADSSVYDMTGPTVFQSVVNIGEVKVESFRVICRQGQFTSKRFQYVDKPRGHWTDEQADKSIVI